jgi:hypothetical protein
MKMILFVLFALFSLSDVRGTSPGQIYCGRKLANTLAYLCSAGMLEKRAMSFVEFEELSWPWLLPKTRALEDARSKRGGVATECCNKPCTREVLLSYC